MLGTTNFFENGMDDNLEKMIHNLDNFFWKN